MICQFYINDFKGRPVRQQQLQFSNTVTCETVITNTNLANTEKYVLRKTNSSETLFSVIKPLYLIHEPIREPLYRQVGKVFNFTSVIL